VVLKKVFAPFVLFLCFLHSAGAQSGVVEGRKKIPLLISDHHADHALWLVRHVNQDETVLVLLDAHADAEINREGEIIREFLAHGFYNSADNLFNDHNWIHPLTPSPVNSLVWISRISGFPGGGRVEGFLRSAGSWDIRDAASVSVEEIGALPIGDGKLFVSIDLDFFYNENYTPPDIPYVFDRLWDYSSAWAGEVLWGLCLSRPWLPSDEYAWELLEQSLRWLASRPEFAAPELSLFTVYRYDGSRKAEAFRAEGTEPPGFYGREDEAPEAVKRLLGELNSRAD
jgi:hypothetical protein